MRLATAGAAPIGREGRRERGERRRCRRGADPQRGRRRARRAKAPPLPRECRHAAVDRRKEGGRRPRPPIVGSSSCMVHLCVHSARSYPFADRAAPLLSRLHYRSPVTDRSRSAVLSRRRRPRTGSVHTSTVCSTHFYCLLATCVLLLCYITYL